MNLAYSLFITRQVIFWLFEYNFLCILKWKRQESKTLLQNKFVHDPHTIISNVDITAVTLGTPVSTKNKTECHDITEILLKLKVALNTNYSNCNPLLWYMDIKLQMYLICCYQTCHDGTFISSPNFSIIRSNIFIVSIIALRNGHCQQLSCHIPVQKL